MPSHPTDLALIACRDALADLLPAYLATVRVMLDGEARRRPIVPATDVMRYPVVVAADAALRSAGL